jgi:ribonuclease HII
MEALSSLLQHAVRPEEVLHKKGYRYIAGVDEAGRGPLAGPVVAAAVLLPDNWTHPDIKDSKQLTAQKREYLFDIVSEHALSWSWAEVDHVEIDHINILQASLKAMQRAVELLSLPPEYLLIDGSFPITSSIPQTPLVKGDQKSLATSAASIMAKVIRDSIMQQYHELYPQYNFAKNKGYGTKEHLQALAYYGPSPIHRKSFTVRKPQPLQGRY